MLCLSTELCANISPASSVVLLIVIILTKLNHHEFESSRVKSFGGSERSIIIKSNQIIIYIYIDSSLLGGSEHDIT